jgi:sulfonate transport system permease protein
MNTSSNKSRLDAWIPWVLPFLVVVVWQLLGYYGVISKRILPTPLQVVEAAVLLTKKGLLLKYIGISTWRAFQGFIIGGGIGFILGLVNGLSRSSEKFTDTSVQMLRTIPHLALIPLVIAWFGIGETGKLFLVSLGVMFPIYLNTFHGIRSIDPGLIEMGRVYGLKGRGLFWQIILPGALPFILVGVRFALGIMWLSLIVAETISANSGIGYMSMNAREFFQMDVIVLGIIIYALLGKLSDGMAKWMERRWLQWHPNFKK